MPRSPVPWSAHLDQQSWQNVGTLRFRESEDHVEDLQDLIQEAYGTSTSLAARVSGGRSYSAEGEAAWRAGRAV